MYVSEQEWYKSRASTMQTPSEGKMVESFSRTQTDLGMKISKFQETTSQNDLQFNQTGNFTSSTFKMDFEPKVDQTPNVCHNPEYYASFNEGEINENSFSNTQYEMINSKTLIKNTSQS